MSTDGQKQSTVAIIGSGMAGLVSAYLIQRDPRYKVEIFETQDQLSLDSASYTPKPADGHTLPSRIDIPMRALDNGYHNNLKRMYDYLAIKYTSPRFIYPLSAVPTDDGNKMSPYYIHSSSNHQVPPIRPQSCGYVTWVLRTMFLAVCYAWFTICCFLLKPKPGTFSTEDETLQQYLARIRLPRSFSKHYLLPLLSSITTCPHDALLNFPAIDCVEYAKRTYRQPHYTVVGGVQNVQAKVSNGQITKLGATVTAVKNVGTMVRVSWTDSNTKVASSKDFDHVIMAVTPNVVGAIYEPLREAMSSIPVVFGESVVHHDLSTIPDCGQSLQKVSRNAQHSPDQHQIMHICSDSSSTESIHVHSSSVFVTNFPIRPIDPSKIVHRARLARVLRTPKSRKVINQIFAVDGGENTDQEKEQSWRNGSGNVWLVGAWCWDGMVLLEGCVVSAMTVATNLGVEVPWMTKK